MKLIICIESFLEAAYLKDLYSLVEEDCIEQVVFLKGTKRVAEILDVADEYKTFEATVKRDYANKYITSECVDINEFFAECKDENDSFLLSTSGIESKQKYLLSAVVSGFEGKLTHRGWYEKIGEYSNEQISNLIRDFSERQLAGRSRKKGREICEPVYKSEDCTFELGGKEYKVTLPEVVPCDEGSRGGEGFTFKYPENNDYRIKIWYTTDGQKVRKSQPVKGSLAVYKDKLRMIEAMVKRGLDHPQIAFPLALVRNKSGNAVGFVMRNFNDFKVLSCDTGFENKDIRKERLSFLLDYMKLLSFLFAKGIIVTDLIHNSLRRLTDNAPCIIDIDSVQYGAYNSNVCEEPITIPDFMGSVEIAPIPCAYRREKIFYSTAAHPFVALMLIIGVYINPTKVYTNDSNSEVSVDSSPIPNKTLRDFVENVYTNTDENGKVKPIALERVMDLAEQLIREEKGESEATEEAVPDEVKDTQADEKDTSDTELTLEERLRRWREERNSSEDADPLRGDALSIGGSEAPVPKPTPAPVASGCTDQGNNTIRRPEIKPGQNTVQGDEGKRPRPQPKPMQKISQNNDSKGSSQNNTVKEPMQKTPQGNDSKGSSQNNTVKKPVQRTPQGNDNSKKPEPESRDEQRTLAARIGKFVTAFIEWLIDRSLSGTLPVGVNTRTQKINYIKTNKTQRNKVIFDGVKFAVTITLPIVLFLLILKFL